MQLRPYCETFQLRLDAACKQSKNANLARGRGELLLDVYSPTLTRTSIKPTPECSSFVDICSISSATLTAALVPQEAELVLVAELPQIRRDFDRTSHYWVTRIGIVALEHLLTQSMLVSSGPGITHLHVFDKQLASSLSPPDPKHIQLAHDHELVDDVSCNSSTASQKKRFIQNVCQSLNIPVRLLANAWVTCVCQHINEGKSFLRLNCCSPLRSSSALGMASEQEMEGTHTHKKGLSPTLSSLLLMEVSNRCWRFFKVRFQCFRPSLSLYLRCCFQVISRRSLQALQPSSISILSETSCAVSHYTCIRSQHFG